MGRKRSWRLKNREARGVTIEELEDGESSVLGEIGCVGTGIGGGFKHISELAVKIYSQAIKGPDRNE